MYSDPAERDSKPLSPTHITFKAWIVEIEPTVPSNTLSFGPDSRVISRDLEFTNTRSSLSFHAVDSVLGSARTVSDTIRDGERRVYELDIPVGTQTLRAGVGDVSDPNADLDLYVFHNVKGVFVLQAQADAKTSHEWITISDPEAGAWRIVLDAFKVPDGVTRYSYQDIFSHSVFGEIVVGDKPEVRPLEPVINFVPLFTLS
jgi:hypothetical protein